LRQKESFGEAENAPSNPEVPSGEAENAIFHQKEDFDYADNETNHRAVAF
jgi:hypothetical protein